MKTLEEIKNEVAQQHGFSNYKEFCQLTRKIDTDIIFVMDGFFNKVAKRYAKEVVIASLEKASNNLRQASGSFNSDFYSQKMSITNVENIVL